MPSAGFFRQAGLFVVSDFLPPQFVADLRREMETAPKEKAVVVKPGGEERVDENVRKVEDAILPKEIRTPLKDRLVRLIPALEQHFHVRLAGCESPQYLIYGPGDFFKPHADADYSTKNDEIRKRRVSAVIFLSRESEEPAEDAHGHGRLTFYGLLQGPQWERCGFALNPEPGLLIAFPSDRIHEVTPVSHGKRFTIATWFYTSATESAVETPRPMAIAAPERNV